MAAGNSNPGCSVPESSARSRSPSGQNNVQDGERHGYSALSLSVDSGTSSADFSQLHSDTENIRLGDRYLCDHLDMNGFSEEELLNITFEACDAAGQGEVLASTVVQFLQAMTGQSGGQDKLIVLKRMLDPEDRDPPVDRDAFHATMRKWIARCSQDGLFDDSCQASGSDSCKVTGRGAGFSPSPPETTFTDQSEDHCDAGDLLGLVAELKHAQCRLGGHNSSLLRSISQCEETNLQLMMDVSELRSKLASAQLCAGRARSLAEELDEARRALRQSQERSSRAQANGRSLMKEIEHLKAHIKVMEEKNDKLLLERNGAEDRLNRLRRANADVREELEELRVVLAVKEREITKKNITLQKLKETFLDYLRIIDGLQCDLLRLQENSQQALLRFDKSSSSLKNAAAPNHFSLHREIQEAEPMMHVEDKSDSVSESELQPPSSPQRELYNFIHTIKSAELRDAYTAESLQKAILQDQQEHTSSKKHLMTILKELERPRAVWDQQPEHGQIETHQQTQEVRKVQPITWWRALRVEDERNWNTRDTTRDMQERIRVLEIQLNDAQMEVEKSRKGLGEARVRVQKADAAVQTEQAEDERKRVAEENVLESLRKVEMVVTRALQAAEMLTESERRMKGRMEAVGHKVEEVLSRAADTENQLRGLEAQVYPRSSDISAQPDVRTEDIGHHPAFCCNILVSDPVNPNRTYGGCFPNAGAEDNSRECISQDAHDGKETLKDSSELVVECEITVLSDSSSSSDHLPVGLVNKQNAPVNDCSERESAAAAAHGPVPETSLIAACEERTHHDSRENRAGSEEPGDDVDALRKSAKRKNSGVSLEETGHDQTLKLKENGSFNHKRGDTGRSQESANSGSSESGPSTKWDESECAEKRCSPDPEQCAQTFQTLDFHLSGCASKTSGHCKDEPGASEAETNGNVKDSITKWTSNGQESGARKSSDAYEAGSVHICQAHAAETAGTLKKGIPAECEEAESPAEPASPRSLHTVLVPESHTPFFFPRTRSRPPTPPTMPTLPEEEEDSPEEIDSASSSPSSVMPVESKLVNVTLLPPAIVLPRQVSKQDPRPVEKARPHSPRPRLSRNASSSGPITTVDNDGHVIDLVKDRLPEMQLSEEDRQKNLELLEEAKKVSDRFLTRRGRRSTCSLTDSPTALSPNPTPGSSPVPSRSSSTSAPPQIEVLANPPSGPSPSQRLEVPTASDVHGEANKPEQETLKKLVEWKPPEKRKVSSGTLTPRHTASAPAKELAMPPKDSSVTCVSTDRGKKPTPPPVVQKPDSQIPATGVAKPVPRPTMQQAPCTAEIKTIGAFPPLMRAVSWDIVGSLNMRNGGPTGEDGPSYSENLKPPANTQKLSKLREENKLLRNQSISGSKLPELCETAEQDRDHSSSITESALGADSKENAMPNISDIMLRKLKLHRGLPGCAPPLTEKEVENAFVQLSLAFRNDNYTLDTRLKQAERERNLTEENTDKELEEFRNSLKSTVSLWQNVEQREFYQRLIETISVLHRLTNRLSSRAEMVGAVRQALPRRRVSVAVVPKFNLLNIPGQAPTTGGPGPGANLGIATAGASSGPGALPVLSEANGTKSESATDPAQHATGENGKVLLEQEGDAATPAKATCSPEEISAETKAKIEEEAYNKGYQEGLKKLKELQEEKAEDKITEAEEITGEDLEEEKKPS
ncbi:protein MRVI1-like, partial [Clarias magur]